MVGQEAWEGVTIEDNADKSFEVFTIPIFTMLNAVAPIIKQVKITCDDPAWMN